MKLHQFCMGVWNKEVSDRFWAGQKREDVLKPSGSV